MQLFVPGFYPGFHTWSEGKKMGCISFFPFPALPFLYAFFLYSLHFPQSVGAGERFKLSS